METGKEHSEEEDTSGASKELFDEPGGKVSMLKMLGTTIQEMFLATLNDEDSKNLIFNKIISEIITRRDFQLYTADRFYQAMGETKAGIIKDVTSLVIDDLVKKDSQILKNQIRDGLNSNEELKTYIFEIANSFFQSQKKQMLRDIMPKFVKFKKPDSEIVNVELTHEMFQEIIEVLPFGNVMLIGPTGSGKTHLAEQIARTMGLKFYFNGAISSEYKLSGFIDANSRYVTTPFRQAYENGGVYLFDEIDASSPQALLSFNAALTNGHADFPDCQVPVHKNFHCIAAANTYGRGADRLYVGRNQLDAASLDRFIVKDMDYDETLERALSQSNKWTKIVQSWRKACRALDVRHIISSRAIIIGSKMIKAGLNEAIVADSVVWKGLSGDIVDKIKQYALDNFPISTIVDNDNENSDPSF
jgi:hypothetical protein